VYQTKLGNSAETDLNRRSSQVLSQVLAAGDAREKPGSKSGQS
jgi:hypothetical protein